MSNQKKSALIYYRYDALDRLISHYPIEGSERQRFYCKARLVTETEGAEHFSIVQQGDQLLAQQQRHGCEFNSTLITTDQRNSVLNALHPQCPRAIAYSPYGHRIAESGFGSLLGFNGQRPDPMTGHYLLGNGYRAFNPVLMRFNSPDNQSPFGKGGLNTYTYCLGDPVNGEDPTGHVPKFLKGREKSIVKNGTSVKKQRNVTRISEAVFTSEDVTKRGSRITIYAHGRVDTITDAGRHLGPEQVIYLAERNGVLIKKFDSVRLFICNSADDGVMGRSSTGAQFSILSGLPVKAFRGKVHATQIFPLFEGLKVGSTHRKSFKLAIDKALLDVNYHPVTYDPNALYKAAELVRNE
jgi:RHS repeat-associated protein